MNICIHSYIILLYSYIYNNIIILQLYCGPQFLDIDNIHIGIAGCILVIMYIENVCIPVYVFPNCNKLALFPYMRFLIIYLPCKHNTF